MGNYNVVIKGKNPKKKKIQNKTPLTHWNESTGVIWVNQKKKKNTLNLQNEIVVVMLIKLPL